jgi:hypothetical protein
MQVASRVIFATDVSFDVKLNALNKKSGSTERVVVTQGGEDAKQKQLLSNNESIVADLQMKDAINFSTVIITLQQPGEIITTTVANTSDTWAKNNRLFSRAFLSLQKGFYILCNILIYILQLWWLLPIFFMAKSGYTFGKKYLGNGVGKGEPTKSNMWSSFLKPPPFLLLLLHLNLQSANFRSLFYFLFAYCCLYFFLQSCVFL